MVNVNLKLPPSWVPELRAAAKANGVSQADVIRMALRSFLSNRPSREVVR